MKRTISLAIVACLCLSMVVQVSAIVHVEYQTVSLVYTEFEDVLLAAENNALEDLLYPSGMTLPTKFADLFMFASNYQNSVVVPVQIKRVLELNWPTSNGKYTMAEVLTVELYYYTYCWQYYTEDDMSFVSRAIEDLSYTRFNFSGNTYTAVVPDTRVFTPVLKKYADILSSTGKDEGNPMNSEYYSEIVSSDNEYGVQLSPGYQYNWLHYIHPDRQSDDVTTMREQLAGYYGNLTQYWGLFNIQFRSCMVDLLDLDHLLAYNLMDHAVLGAGLLLQADLPLFAGDLPSQSEDGVSYIVTSTELPRPVLPEPSEYQDFGVSTIPVTPTVPDAPDASMTVIDTILKEPNSNSESNTITSTNRPSSGAIGGYATAVDPETIPARRIGIVDVLTVLSIIVVLAIVVGLCVVDFIRKRENPSARWKRR